MALILVIAAALGCRGSEDSRQRFVGTWRWDWKASPSGLAMQKVGVIESSLTLSKDGTGVYPFGGRVTWTARGDTATLDMSNSDAYIVSKRHMPEISPLVVLNLSPDQKSLVERRPQAGPNGMEIVNIFVKEQ